jgi:hypothetical protein
MCQPQGDAFESARDSKNAMFRIDALPRYCTVVPDSRDTQTSHVAAPTKNALGYTAAAAC